jgi:hypothetical protein
MSAPAASAADEEALARREWEELRDAGLLLKARDMAAFTARGLLSFDALVPDEINQAVLAGIAAGTIGSGGYVGDAFADLWPGDHPLGRVFRLPRVRGIIASLVGPRPRHDHTALHTVGPRHRHAQAWHADATIDPRANFDIQVMYFPHDTPVEMGGTMLLPGSHLRQVHEFEVGRYQHIVGELPTVCPAGSIHVLHHGLWHRARGNATDRARSMLKLRLNPAWKQERLFDTAGHDGDEVARILLSGEPWHGSDTRLEFINRLRLWRELTGDPACDPALWLSRLEASPRRRLAG